MQCNRKLRWYFQLFCHIVSGSEIMAPSSSRLDLIIRPSKATLSSFVTSGPYSKAWHAPWKHEGEECSRQRSERFRAVRLTIYRSFVCHIRCSIHLCTRRLQIGEDFSSLVWRCCVKTPSGFCTVVNPLKVLGTQYLLVSILLTLVFNCHDCLFVYRLIFLECSTNACTWGNNLRSC